jgi:hypothetical protein
MIRINKRESYTRILYKELTPNSNTETFVAKEFILITGAGKVFLFF